MNVSVEPVRHNGRLLFRRRILLPLLLPLAGLCAVPAAANAAASIHWDKAVRIEPAKIGGLNAVSCPSTNLCVSVDQGGDVLVTTKPTGGAGSWSAAVRVDRVAGGHLGGVSCPKTTFCAAVDGAGDVTIDTGNPALAKDWSKPAKIDSTVAPGGGDVGLNAISCSSPALCVAVDGAQKGDVVVSTDPAGGARTWKVTAIAAGPLTSVSCASATLCVAAGDQHYVSTDPAGGASAWKGTGAQAGGGVFSGIDCATTALCIGVGYGDTTVGEATTATSPRGGASAWKSADLASDPPVPGESLVDAVGCAGTALCVALDTADNAYTSSSPAGGTWGGPSAIRPKSASSANAISCTKAFCVVVDSAGVETTGVIKG